MTSEPEWKFFHATLVTTHAVGAYGGFQFPREALDRLADQINTRGLPMSQNHDSSQRLRTRNMRAVVRARADGEYGLEAEGEVHPDDAEVLVEIPGLSLTVYFPLAGEADRPDGNAVTIAGNPAWFADSSLSAAENLISRVAPAQAFRMYEFSHEPDANIVITFTKAAFSLVGGNILWDAVKVLWAGRRLIEGRESAPTRITLDVQDGFRSAIGTVETGDRRVAKKALGTFEHAIDRVFESPNENDKEPTFMWNASEERWDEI